MGNVTRKQANTILRRVIDRVERRRFGLKHDKPCKNPVVLTCAASACQRANECQYKNEIGEGA